MSPRAQYRGLSKVWPNRILCLLFVTTFSLYILPLRVVKMHTREWCLVNKSHKQGRGCPATARAPAILSSPGRPFSAHFKLSQDCSLYRLA